MATLTQVHSVPVKPQLSACQARGALPHPRLRPYVVGYSGFRSGSGAAVAHRILPLNVTTLVVDVTGPYGVVTGARSTPAVGEVARWREGVGIGLTPAGVAVLLGVPMAELTGQVVRLADLPGDRAARLADRLAGVPDWPTRFALLDAELTTWVGRDHKPDGFVVESWWRLQRSPRRLRIATLAVELGVSRRYLELGFRRQIGLSPATVARIARFQRAVHRLGQGAGLSKTATDSGYADQPHFTRDVRAMAGLTPTELCAFLQYRPLTDG